MTVIKAPVQKQGADQQLSAQEIVDFKTQFKIVGSDNTTITDGNVIENEIWLLQSEYDNLGEQPTTILFHIKSDVTNEIVKTFIGKSAEPLPAPVITLNGANPQIIEIGTPYTELGATTDDGSTVVIDASAVDVNVVGNYNVTYNATNTEGTPAIEVIRQVQIVDTTAPAQMTITNIE